MKRLLVTVLLGYLIASAVLTAAYHVAPRPTPDSETSLPWEIATRRSGLLIVDVDASGVWMLNPLTSYGDDWLPIFEF